MKISNHFFSDKLAEIINLSFLSGIFPDLCKLSKIIPIFKKDDPLLCINYRPISLLSNISKLFEKLVYKRMYSFLDQNNLIYDKQFGFRSKHSTSHALISATEYIKTQLDSGYQVGGVFIDLEKAFDTVNHDILCDKLSYYGFRGISQQLIKSFLTNRLQYVSINGFNSSKLPVKCGVPQGSTLGPLLFLLYINDLRYSIKSSITSHFADDTCILFSSRKVKSLETILNTDLKSCSVWLKANRLSLNVDKSKLIIFKTKKKIIDYTKISFKLDGFKLVPSDHVKYLGVFMDQHLDWDYQIKQLGTKLSRANGVLLKLRHYVPIETLIGIYYSIFYSHLHYAIPVWSLTTKQNLEPLIILQKKCVRIMNFAPYNSHTIDLFSNNKLLRLDDIIKFEQLKFIFDFKNNNLPDDLYSLFQHNSEINCHGTRNVFNEGLFIPQIQTVSHGNRSLRYAAAVLWNEFVKFDEELNKISKIGSFKKHLKKFFISSYKN